MSFTMTRTATESFTLTHAKYLASKVTADMKRCQQLYSRPTDSEIDNYGTELALLLRDGYVDWYEFGFAQDNKRVISWHYTASGTSLLGGDDRPGKIASGADVLSARFFNFLSYSAVWYRLAKEERERIERELPIHRHAGEPPKDGAGCWAQDRCYSSNGVSLARKTFRPLSL
jgi:hypothetical protein